MIQSIDALTVDDLSKLFQQEWLDDEYSDSRSSKACLEAAVCILFVREDGQWKLLFTRRTETVRDHKGQVSFPGGAREEFDSSLQETALRETFEEIGVRPQDVRIIGRLPSMKTISSYIISPFIGTIEWPYPLTIASDEVSRVFLIPVHWLVDDAHWEMNWIEGLPDGIRRQVIKYKLFDGELLWGISAYFARQVVKLIKEYTRS
jgi:8-oxo-dGTP pyrophosphatase MutT (NUDIX family)